MALTLALDLATVTGFALGDLAGIKVSGSRRMPKTGDDLGYFAHAYRTWLTTGLQRHKPARVVFEQPIMRGEGSSLVTLRKLYGLAWQTELTCRDLKIPCQEVNMSDWRVHFLGKGNVPRKREAVKAAVMQMCRVRGFEFDDDNEAEAIAILDYALACATPAFAINASPLFNHPGNLPPTMPDPPPGAAKAARTAALKKAAGLQ